MSSSRPRAGQGIDYSNRSYWISRFSQEAKFEWLTPPSILSSRILHYLNPGSEITPSSESSEASKSTPSKVVHIGCGNSELSLEIRRITPPNIPILNIDYATPVLERMRQAELEAFGDLQMRWETVDLLKWDETRTVVLEHSSPEVLLIIDKSCIDAISCGQDVLTPLNASSPQTHPDEALALHIGGIAALGSIWLVLSYSPGRFDFLLPGGSKIRHVWDITSTELIPAQTGVDVSAHPNVHVPEVYHTLFTLKRTSNNVAQ